MVGLRTLQLYQASLDLPKDNIFFLPCQTSGNIHSGDMIYLIEMFGADL